MRETRTSHGKACPLTPIAEVLRRTHPFGTIRRDGAAVGCWFTEDAYAGRADGGPDARPALRVNYYGMVRTAGGRVAGVSGNAVLHRHFADDVMRMLSDASRETLALPRRTIASDFVYNVRHAADLVRWTWTPNGEAYSLREAGNLVGLDDWSDADRAEALAAIKDLHKARCAVLQRFLDTLDSMLVDALKPHALDAEGTVEHDGMLGEAWPLLDAGFGRGAPLRDRVVPIIDNQRRVERLMRRHVRWSRSEKGYGEEWDRHQEAKQARRFLPAEPVDLTHLAPPGFG